MRESSSLAEEQYKNIEQKNTLLEPNEDQLTLQIGSCLSLSQIGIAEYDKNRILKAPDGGYGWIILGSSFMIYVIMAAMCYTQGVFLTIFEKQFKKSKAESALPGSIFIGCMCIFGPLASIISNKFSHRVTTIIGAIIMAVGFMSSVFVTELYPIYITFGIIGGTGMSLFFSPCIALVSMYFDKWRSLAVGVTVTGLGIGTFIFPIIIKASMEYYGWRGSLILLSGFSIHGIIFGALLRPLPMKVNIKTKPKLIDSDLFHDRKFYLYFIANLCIFLSMMQLWTIMPDQAIEKGIIKDRAHDLVSFAGIFNAVGRIVFAFFANWKKCHRVLALGIITLVIVTPIVTLVIFAKGYITMVVLASIFGFIFGLLSSAQPIVIGELFTVEKMTSAFGLVLVSDAIGSLTAPPIAGLIFDQTNSYFGSGILSGILATISGTIITAIAIFDNKKYPRLITMFRRYA